MRFWIAKDKTKGIMFITLSKFARIEGHIRDAINDTIKSSWADCENWPRKFTKRVDTNLPDIVSGEVDISPKINTEMKDKLCNFKVA